MFKYSKDFISNVEKVFGEGEALIMAQNHNPRLGRVIDEAMTYLPYKQIFELEEKNSQDFISDLKKFSLQEIQKEKLYFEFLNEIKKENRKSGEYSKQFISSLQQIYGNDIYNFNKTLKEKDLKIFLDSNRSYYDFSNLLAIINSKNNEKAKMEILEMAQSEKILHDLFEMWKKEYLRDQDMQMGDE